MRVLLVNYEFPDVTANCGGGGEVTKQLAGALSDRGHTVKVFTDTADGRYWTFPFRTYRPLKEEVRRFQPDVINGHFSVPSSLMLPAVRMEADCPVVVSIMGADVYDPTRYTWARPALTAANRYLDHRAAAVVAPSRDLADRYRDQTGTEPTVIPYGIAPDTYEWRRRELSDRVRVLTVARLVDRKNLWAGAGGVSRLNPQGKTVEYRIVGTGPRHGELAAHAEGKPWLSVAGYVDDLHAEYRAADVFLLPSHHEAFGMVVLEALAAGLPVVTTDTGGQSELVTPAVGAVADGDTSDVIADALRRVLKDYDGRQQATRGYVADYYSRRRMAEDYEHLYRGVLADSADSGRAVVDGVAEDD